MAKDRELTEKEIGEFVDRLTDDQADRLVELIFEKKKPKKEPEKE